MNVGIILLIIVIITLVACAILLWSPRQRLWRQFQRERGLSIHLSTNAQDILCQAPFVAVTQESSALLALLLRQVFNHNILVVGHEEMSEHLKNLFRRNRILFVDPDKIDATYDLKNDVVLVSHRHRAIWQWHETPMVLTVLMGAEGIHDKKPICRRQQLHLNFTQYDRSRDISTAYKFFETRCWQSYIPSLPTLMHQWVRRAKLAGKHLALADSLGVELSYFRLLVAVKSMRELLARALGDHKNIGICLPTSAGAVIAMLACWSLGKTQVQINYTASQMAIGHALDAAGVKVIITSKRFLKALKDRGVDLQPLFKSHHLIYVETLKNDMSKFRLFKNALSVRWSSGKQLADKMLTPVSHEDTAVILFSSGSEGRPKGIELTFANIMGNAKQVAATLALKQSEVVMSVLPMFHAFGLTVNTVAAQLAGLTLVCHADPRDAATIGKLTKQYRGTVLCGTSSFFRLYTRSRAVTTEMFSPLRLVIAGAEKLQQEVAVSFKEKFDKTIYEGYGTTELSPVVAVNHSNFSTYPYPGQKPGTVGYAIPGCVIRIVHPETHDQIPNNEPGMVSIAGINVMKGYVNQPDKTAQAIFEYAGLRWYKTGDKGKLDDAGFLTIVDRYSRFAKIAGEMISLGAVEQQIAAMVKDDQVEIAAIAIPEKRKGEQVVLLVEGKITVETIKRKIAASKMDNLMKPADIFKVKSIPKLGSGKIDYVEAKGVALKLAKV